MHAKIDGVPFSVLTKQAVALKAARLAPLRSVYDSYPRFYQNSIFPNEDVVNSRCFGTFEERLNAASKLKERGNEQFHQPNFADALLQYEKACAVFKYLENTNPNWKSEVSRVFTRRILVQYKISNEISPSSGAHRRQIKIFEPPFYQFLSIGNQRCLYERDSI